jgi:GTPase Era involved in 16S rRNA processing
LFAGAAALIVTPYLIVFTIGSVWMWQHGLLWCWALGTGVPTVAGLTLLEWARRTIFPPTEALPHPSPAATLTGQAATQAVRQISERLQAEDPPLDQPEVLERVMREVLVEVLETVARQYHPQVDRPVLQAPVAHIAAVVELVAHDFRETFSEKVPWGKTVTPGQLLWWKQQGELGWRFGTYLWQINRVRRMCMRPGTALIQELHDHWGQNLATKSMGGLKQWMIDYCVTKAGDYAIQLYSGGFVRSDEYRPRISAGVEALPFDQEPLQILVVGQVKAGKSSLINALLGEPRAPVDTLPATEDVDRYECQPEGLPPIILRDTPGYGTVGDAGDPFSGLGNEIQECDLLVMVCTARSAARQADRELLRKIHEFYQRHPQRIMPPMVYVLTHLDTVPEHLVAEAAEAVASDLGVAAGQIVAACTQWDRLANMEGVVATLREKLPEAERLRCSRCIRQIRREQDEDKILRQVLNGLRLTGGWIVKNT